jgi:hypothetical protein
MGAWLVMLVIPLDAGPHGSSSLESVAMAVGIALFFLVVFVAPVLVPSRILRARQPGGAHIAWDDAGVVEYDGAWRRAVVPWATMVASRFSWKEYLKSGTVEREALQLVDRDTGACIVAWECAVPRGPIVRRRLVAPKIAALHAAIEAHGVALAEAPSLEWSRALDPDRSRPLKSVYLGRVGYVAGVLAPLFAGPTPAGGLALGAAGAALLIVRALPVLREVRAIQTRLAAAPHEADASDANAAARADADRAKLRAARAEAAIRVALVPMLAAATLVSAFVLSFAGPR